jgi:enamine deaminase RidA (YjgF/YER057c/UK114 family)
VRPAPRPVAGSLGYGYGVGAEDRVTELGLEIPSPAAPVASYVPVVVSGGLAFVSGQVAMESGRLLFEGRVGAELTVEEGSDAARRCALQVLAALRAELGSLDRVRRIVRVGVFVASAPGFTEQPKVANGASDLLGDVFGQAGRHARAAVGVAELPLGAPVEVEAIAEIEPELIQEIEAELVAEALPRTAEANLPEHATRSPRLTSGPDDPEISLPAG